GGVDLALVLVDAVGQGCAALGELGQLAFRLLELVALPVEALRLVVEERLDLARGPPGADARAAERDEGVERLGRGVVGRWHRAALIGVLLHGRAVACAIRGLMGALRGLVRSRSDLDALRCVADAGVRRALVFARRAHARVTGFR